MRVIAATNRDLEAMIREGRFREDLYYRLNLVQIWLPPLRKYRQSIPGMVKAFVEEAARVHGKRVKGVAADALAALKAHDFPGNVRELKNVVERAVILETGEQIHLRSLPSQLRGAKAVAASPTARVDGDYKAARRKLLDEFEDRFLRDILARSHGNIQKASRLSGINRVSLHKLLSRRGIEAKDYR
ncbi:MAG: sigma 54-interacting transcriptional regulator [Acidobacteriota bacterium]